MSIRIIYHLVYIKLPNYVVKVILYTNAHNSFVSFVRSHIIHLPNFIYNMLDVKVYLTDYLLLFFIQFIAVLFDILFRQ